MRDYYLCYPAILTNTLVPQPNLSSILQNQLGVALDALTTGIPDDVAKKKVFPLSLKGDALTWYRLCDDTRSWNYRTLKLEFHQKYYPMHLVHRDRNYIYNFWPHEGESIAQAWGRLKSMLYSCPNHELSRVTIIQKIYARLSDNDRTMLDTSCT